MRTLNAYPLAAVAAVAVVSLTACGGHSGSTATTSAAAAPTTTVQAETTQTTEAPATTAAPAGSLADYLKAHNITRTDLGPGQSRVAVQLPTVEGWKTVPPSPEASYGGLVYSKAANPADPPQLRAMLFRLGGQQIDGTEILKLAPNALNSRPEFKAMMEAKPVQFAGYDATQVGGTYTENGVSRLVAQKTVAIPANDGLYILELVAEGPESDAAPLVELTSAIDKDTTITK